MIKTFLIPYFGTKDETIYDYRVEIIRDERGEIQRVANLRNQGWEIMFEETEWRELHFRGSLILGYTHMRRLK